MAKTKIILSIFLVLVILTSSYYILMPDKFRVDITPTKATYSVSDGESWTLAASEYIWLFEGSKKMRAKNRTLEYNTIENFTTFERVANYKNGIIVKDYISFDSSKNDIELIPVNHTIHCYNCLGKILHFEYRDILYDGLTKEITSPFSFGNNMKLEWGDGAYKSKVYQQKVASDKIIIRYRPQNIIDNFYVRLFDPILSNNITLHHPANGYYNDTHLQNELFFNCTSNYNATKFDLYLTNSTNESFAIHSSKFFNINQTNSTANWTIALHTGDYTWNCRAGNSSATEIWGVNRTFKLNASGVNYTFRNLSVLGYNINFSLINWSAVLNSSAVASGNFTWNFTQIDINPVNFSSYLFSIENTGYYSVAVNLSKDEDKNWYNWSCRSKDASCNITVSGCIMFTLVRAEIGVINCSLFLHNASQQYINWSKVRDNATYNFTFKFEW